MEQENKHHTSQSVGEILKQARKEKGLDLKDISGEINVRCGQLEAIESGNMQELPGMVYAIGFVRSYAIQLGLDGEEMSLLFKAEHGTVEPSSAEINLQPSIQNTQMPNFPILVSSGIGIIILLSVWFIFFNGEDNKSITTDNATPEVPIHLKVQSIKEKNIKTLATANIITNTTKNAPQNQITSTVVTKKPAVSTTDNQNYSPVVIKKAAIIQKKPALRIQKKQTGKSFGAEQSKSRISLRAKASSWVQIKDRKGNTDFRKVLRPGQIYRAPTTKGMTLTTANAGGLEVFVDGKPMKPFGKPGDIIRGISLDADEILRKNAY